MITLDYPTLAFFCALFFLIGGLVGLTCCIGVFIAREHRSIDKWEAPDVR